MQEAHALAAKCGVEYVVAKPAEPEEVLRIVDEALGLTRAAVPATPRSRNSTANTFAC